MKELQSFTNNIEGDDHENNSWSLFVSGILAHLIKNDLKESSVLFEKSYNAISKKQRYLVA